VDDIERTYLATVKEVCVCLFLCVSVCMCVCVRLCICGLTRPPSRRATLGTHDFMDANTLPTNTCMHMHTLPSSSLYRSLSLSFYLYFVSCSLYRYLSPSSFLSLDLSHSYL
jgi:hypothetical protein